MAKQVDNAGRKVERASRRPASRGSSRPAPGGPAGGGHSRNQAAFAQTHDRLASMASGVVQRLTDHLTCILGHSDLILADTEPASPWFDHLCGIEEAAWRASELCRQMVTYMGTRPIETEKTDLSRLVRQMSEMLKVSIFNRVTLHLSCPDDLPRVDVDPSQIRQLVMNLVVNASEAIGSREGQVWISTGSVELAQAGPARRYVNDAPPAGSYVSIDVEDSGRGFEPSLKTRIFDPFYTTKPGGLGLGLSAVLGIVRSHGAFLSVDSAVGRGTTLRILFPAGEPPSPGAGRGPEDDVAGPAKTVLIVDAEPTVLRVAQKLVERLGFVTVTAQTPAEAIRVCEERGDIACAIVDPGVSPDRTLARLARWTPLITCRGRDGRRASPQCLSIDKPYRLEVLKAALEETLLPD